MNKNINRIRDFTDLDVWKEGHRLVLMLYKITDKFPRSERYSLIDQIRRSSISVTSNIAEGFGRQTYKEKIQFYYLAQGSLVELKNQLIISKDVGYIDENVYLTLKNQADVCHKLLQGIIKKSKVFLNHKS
ncbi:MAG: 23S rRNA-intervening sequence protein [Candidatus Woesebacteria bacterium]|nr:MAG: 23S rRNA-intervening sequence protein [Candidatus Woesebacteria bacterium]